MSENKNMWEWEKAFVITELVRKGYRNISFVGQGAFSVVLRAWDDRQSCFWACKVSEISEVAVKEAEMIQRIHHPLFPKYKTSWESHGYFFLVMEYVCGSTVRELCKRRKKFTQRQAVRIALELAQGLLFLHEWKLPVVFRDIKPENVMIRQDGTVKLVDMGCATLISEKQCVAGSKGYSAPEQFEEMPHAGAESDVYALGRLLLFLVTGVEPGSGLHGQADAADWKLVSHKLRRLIQQTIRQERQNRVPDMRVFIKYLTEYEKKTLFYRVRDMTKSILCRKEIVDFYYIQNIRRGIDI